MAELDSHYFNTKDNVRIHYQCNFDIKKTPQEIIVFNYGLVCSDLHWKYQIEHFKKNHPILIYNYRGHFQSTGRKKLETLTIQQFSDDLFEIIKFIKAKKVILIGHSMGVNVCLQFCIDHPELVKKQVLISGAINIGQRDYARLKLNGHHHSTCKKL
jgi:non-heme chloroperoxidase